MDNLSAFANMTTYYINTYGDICDSYILKQKPLKGKLVDVRTEPKINRNATCPKCESGLKYKKCCGKF